jgi:hypothetical protein
LVVAVGEREMEWEHLNVMPGRQLRWNTSGAVGDHTNTAHAGMSSLTQIALALRL